MTKSTHRIFLIGLMGSGKTTIGKIVAKKLHFTFMDSDVLIEEKTGVKVPLIFEYEGEEGFRKREASCLIELVTKNDMVLATGGGMVLSRDNRELLAQSGSVIYLKAHTDELARRLTNYKSRPLLQHVDVKQKLKELLESREVLYESCADYIIQTKNKRAVDIADEIITTLRCHEDH